MRMLSLFLQRETIGMPARGQEISIRGTDIRFFGSQKMDTWSVKEASADRFYERYGLPILPNWTVVDIGAAIGEFTVLAPKCQGLRYWRTKPQAPRYRSCVTISPGIA